MEDTTVLGTQEGNQLVEDESDSCSETEDEGNGQEDVEVRLDPEDAERGRQARLPDNYVTASGRRVKPTQRFIADPTFLGRM